MNRIARQKKRNEKATLAASGTMLIVLLFVLLCAALLPSCNKGLQLQTDFDFEVEMLPVPGTVTLNESVEMRFELTHIGGRYDSTKYYVRYFQYDGKGQLANEAGTVFLPNDSYPITADNFRLYFTPTSGQQHTLELVFYDSFKHKKQVDLSFVLDTARTN